jgi:peptidoglycan/xylan/chitin deacetylase (PgdA/CDA1 family)
VSDVLVLCYHAVSDDWPCEYAVSTTALEAQLSGLLRRGYTGATFSEALSDPRAPRTLAVTFDDAYRSVAERGFEILERLGLRGTVFACTGLVGAPGPMGVGLDGWLGGPHEHELGAMSWAELGALADAGWEVGSHSRTHPRLTRLSDHGLRLELEGSRVDLEDRLGRSCTSLAYPFGDVDARVAGAARRAGYRAAGGVLGVSPGGIAWPRVRVLRHDADRRFRLKSSRLLRDSAAWVPVQRVEGALGRPRQGAHGGAR